MKRSLYYLALGLIVLAPGAQLAAAASQAGTPPPSAGTPPPGTTAKPTATPPAAGTPTAPGTQATAGTPPAAASAAVGEDAKGVDTFGIERQNCRDLRAAGKLTESFSCVKALWENHRAEMSVGGRIESLELMAELYSIAKNFSSAQQCYQEVLRNDAAWRPKSLDTYPASWRQPIFDAYRSFGFLGGSPGLYNLALLDFDVVDLSRKDFDLGTLATALPTLVTSLLEENLNSRTLKADKGAAKTPGAAPRPVRVVPYTRRELLMREIAMQNGLKSDAVINAKLLDQGSLVRAGNVAAVQGFIEGSIVRDAKDRVKVGISMFTVETGEYLCGSTAEGKGADVMKVVERAIVQWAECVTGGRLTEWNARHVGQLGAGAKSVLALEHYHKALEFADQEDYGNARKQLQLALDMRPDFEPATFAMNTIAEQQERLSLTQAMELPKPEGLTANQ
jgi:tetratricopeptide (TPR) repeat protein